MFFIKTIQNHTVVLNSNEYFFMQCRPNKISAAIHYFKKEKESRGEKNLLWVEQSFCNFFPWGAQEK